MKDYLVRSIAFDNQVRIYACHITNAINHVRKNQEYMPSSIDAVGRVLSMATMMGSTLKLDQTVTLKVEGNGPIGKIICDSDAYGHVRAFAEHPDCHFESHEELNCQMTVGDSGMINVIKDLKLKEPFVGSTPIISGKIAEDFAYYYNVSEQVPTAISLGTLVGTYGKVKVCGGFMVQLLPNTSEEIICKLEDRLKLLPPISEMLKSNITPEEIIKNIADDAQILDIVPVRYRCTCSKKKFANGLITLGKEELHKIIEEDGGCETICHFCGKKYNYSKEELETLENKAK